MRIKKRDLEVIKNAIREYDKLFVYNKNMELSKAIECIEKDVLTRSDLNFLDNIIVKYLENIIVNKGYCDKYKNIKEARDNVFYQLMFS